MSSGAITSPVSGPARDLQVASSQEEEGVVGVSRDSNPFLVSLNASGLNGAAGVCGSVELEPSTGLFGQRGIKQLPQCGRTSIRTRHRGERKVVRR